MDKVNLAAAFARITEHWRPKVVAELNGQEVKLARIRGEFVWHHDEETEVLIFEPAGTRNTGNVEHPTLTAPTGARI